MHMLFLMNWNWDIGGGRDLASLGSFEPGVLGVLVVHLESSDKPSVQGPSFVVVISIEMTFVEMTYQAISTHPFSNLCVSTMFEGILYEKNNHSPRGHRSPVNICFKDPCMYTRIIPSEPPPCTNTHTHTGVPAPCMTHTGLCLVVCVSGVVVQNPSHPVGTQDVKKKNLYREVRNSGMSGMSFQIASPRICLRAFSLTSITYTNQLQLLWLLMYRLWQEGQHNNGCVTSCQWLISPHLTTICWVMVSTWQEYKLFYRRIPEVKEFIQTRILVNCKVFTRVLDEYQNVSEKDRIPHESFCNFWGPRRNEDRWRRQHSAAWGLHRTFSLLLVSLTEHNQSLLRCWHRRIILVSWSCVSWNVADLFHSTILGYSEKGLFPHILWLMTPNLWHRMGSPKFLWEWKKFIKLLHFNARLFEFDTPQWPRPWRMVPQAWSLCYIKFSPVPEVTEGQATAT